MANIRTKLIDWWQPLPAWAKGVVVVGGGAVVVYTGYSIVQSINAAKRKKEEEAKLKRFSDDLTNLNNSGIYQSYQQSQYEQWADVIQTQFTGCDFSTPGFGCGLSGFSNSGRIVLNIVDAFKNDADFLALQTAFGTRDISKHWWCGGDMKAVTLSAAIVDQLSAGEIECLQTKLQSKNIKYRF